MRSSCFGKFEPAGFQKSISEPKPVQASKPPSRTPDYVFSERTTDEQAILYRLSG